MKSRKVWVGAFALLVPIAVAATAFYAGSEERPAVRSFEFSYLTRIPGLPTDAKASRVWIPLPETDSYQTIGDLKIESPFLYSRHRESEYGNEFVYLEVPAGKAVEGAEIRVHFQVNRQEHRVAFVANSARVKKDPPERGELQRFLQPDRRVPLQGVIGELSAEQTRGIQEPLAKARAVYDYVLATMRYDKSGTGWGNGDAIWACTAKRGNCTDFHSLFIGMMRAGGFQRALRLGSRCRRISTPEQ